MSVIREVSQGKRKMGSREFWHGVGIHAVTAILALWLLVKAVS